MTIFVIDVEADGPAPGLYSLVNFAAVEVTPIGPGAHFYGECSPITDQFIPDALAVSGFSREQHLAFPAPAETFKAFAEWVRVTNKGSKPKFLSDNPAFDWQFINYYLWAFTGDNIFGHSARRIGDFYAGLQNDFFARQAWRKLRKTKHTHHPLDDARGNVEAFVALLDLAKAARSKQVR